MNNQIYLCSALRKYINSGNEVPAKFDRQLPFLAKEILKGGPNQPEILWRGLCQNSIDRIIIRKVINAYANPENIEKILLLSDEECAKFNKSRRTPLQSYCLSYFENEIDTKYRRSEVLNPVATMTAAFVVTRIFLHMIITANTFGKANNNIGGKKCIN
jgi:hypothetical protein